MAFTEPYIASACCFLRVCICMFFPLLGFCYSVFKCALISALNFLKPLHNAVGVDIVQLTVDCLSVFSIAVINFLNISRREKS